MHRCHVGGHTKDTCPMFMNYLLSGAPNPLICAGIPWCHICQVYGHRDENCEYMQKMVMKAKNLYYTFVDQWDMIKKTAELMIFSKKERMIHIL